MKLMHSAEYEYDNERTKCTHLRASNWRSYFRQIKSYIWYLFGRPTGFCKHHKLLSAGAMYFSVQQKLIYSPATHKGASKFVIPQRISELLSSLCWLLVEAVRFRVRKRFSPAARGLRLGLGPAQNQFIKKIYGFTTIGICLLLFTNYGLPAINFVNIFVMCILWWYDDINKVLFNSTKIKR